MLAALRDLDLAGLRVARTRGHAPGAERAVVAFSQCGEHAAAWLVLGALGAALDPPRRGRWLRGAGVVGGIYAANTALKLVIRRRRPVLEGLPPLIATPTPLSFPSAHAATSFAARRVYGPLIDRRGARAALTPAAVAMAASRVYLGVHYPSDILAGAVLGTVLAGAVAS